MRIASKNPNFCSLLLVAALVVSFVSCGDPIVKYVEPAGPYHIFVDPTNMHVSKESNSDDHVFDLRIMIENVSDLYAFELRLDIDPELPVDSTDALKVESIAEGSCLSESGNTPTIFLTRYPEGGSYLEIQAARFGSTGVTTYEATHLATVRFQARTAGTVALRWSHSRLIDSTQPNGQEIDPTDHILDGAVVTIQ